MQNTSVRLFQTLSKEEKIAFFLHGQNLLLKYHPNSSFIIYQRSLQERLAHIKTIAAQYNGLVYRDDNICVLFNKIYVVDPKDPVQALKDSKFKAPVDHYNAVSIDFVVFRELNDCLNWTQNNYEPRIRHVLYVKNSKPQIYQTEELMSKVFKIPMSVSPR